MFKLYLLVFSVFKSYSDSTPVPHISESTVEQLKEILNGTRRILQGNAVFGARPYMVWLRPTASDRGTDDDNWLCGGVILHEEYILTSAACIEDVKHFYIVTGTHRWLPPTQTNNCIENGAVRALWKCVPRKYRYDGHAFNNIRWMVNDIAVVQTETQMSFTRRVKGCDFIPQPISYNNISEEYEEPGTRGFIAGWGSTDSFTDDSDILARTRVNSPILREVETIVISKENCKFRWIPRYHTIIDKYMICGKSTEHYRPSAECLTQHVACRQLLFSEEEGPRMRGVEGDSDKLLEESAAEVRRAEQLKKNTMRKVIYRSKRKYGGFCENDHGGPLVYGRGNTAMVIGVISAYRTENNSKSCTGPFLYTSVYNNRHLIHCAMYKKLGNECSTVLRDSSTVMEEETFDWGGMPPRLRTLYEDEPAVLPPEKPKQTPLGPKPVAGNENGKIVL